MKEIMINGLVGSLVAMSTYFFARKKNNADVRKVDAESQHIEVQSVEKAVAIWRQLATELTAELSSLKLEVEHLRIEVEGLRNENKQLKKNLNKI